MDWHIPLADYSDIGIHGPLRRVKPRITVLDAGTRMRVDAETQTECEQAVQTEPGIIISEDFVVDRIVKRAVAEILEELLINNKETIV